MARYSPEEKQLSVVLIGNFNPRIFQPQWFFDHSIISKSDLDYINEEGNMLIHNEVTQFKSSWFSFEVTGTRLTIITTQEAYFEMVLDFLSSTFSVLYHTPIGQMGINLHINQRFDGREDFEKFETQYFSISGFSKIDEDAKQYVSKFTIKKEGIKIGTQCLLEIQKFADKEYLLNVNQHFELDTNATGKEFVKLIGAEGRNSIQANETLMKLIVENKN